jgi:hypothetical protein
VPRPLETALARVSLESSIEVTSAPVPRDAESWLIDLSILSQSESTFIPKRSEWKVVVDNAYPYGAIGIYPSASGGITATFPHQARNSLDNDGKPWRNGKLCLEVPLGGERTARVRDPVGSADDRLLWHVRRARSWVQAAAENALLRPGDPFELPARPPAGLLGEISLIVHDEAPDCLGRWLDGPALGAARLMQIPGVDSTLAVTEFRAGDVIVRSWRGRKSPANAPSVEAIWWLWPKPAVRSPWESPATWGDLRAAGKEQSVVVDDVLRQIARRVRGRSERVVLLLGFPIPARVGGPDMEIHWDAILLPGLSPANTTAPRGFRANELGWWIQDQKHFDSATALERVATENWAPSRLLARGRLESACTSQRVALVGVGALGSVVAELLTRGGVEKIDLFDGDTIVAGNICRHTATLNDRAQQKTAVVGRRLRAISPHVRVDELNENLPNEAEAIEELLDDYTVIIECTASNEVVELLQLPWWPIPRLFISLSVGYAAKKLFVFAARGHRFPALDFERCLRPWLAQESALWQEVGESLEGPGCWSPLFPARYDDVVLAAATCIKEIERLAAGTVLEPTLAVFEQQAGDNGFRGLVRVSSIVGVTA